MNRILIQNVLRKNLTSLNRVARFSCYSFWVKRLALVSFLVLQLLLHIHLSADIFWQADIQKPFALSLRLNSQQITRDEFLHLEAEFYYPSSHQVDIDSLLEQLAWSANPLTPQLNIYKFTIATIPTEEGIQAKKLHAIIRPLAEGPLYISLLNVEYVSKKILRLLLKFSLLSLLFRFLLFPNNWTFLWPH